MKTVTTFLLVLALAFGISACGHGFGMHYTRSHGYANVYAHPVSHPFYPGDLAYAR